jgi:DNA-directed RNA polymerase subunit RPC12/RpoP
MNHIDCEQCEGRIQNTRPSPGQYVDCPHCGHRFIPKPENENRISGKAREPIHNVSECSSLHVTRIESMSKAVEQSRRRCFADRKPADTRVHHLIGTRPVDGDRDRLKAAVEASHVLVDEAIALDPRLAKKAQWLRRDEGEHCDTALLAQGDDQPFYKRTRNIINDETNAGEPLHIVISTDSNHINPGTAAAFIATVRIVQQFVPVHVWWQGSWLSDPNKYPQVGFVFHVPLVQGDMDFSRLEFCIADQTRDIFSNVLSITYCVHEFRETNAACGFRADRSYLPEHADDPHTHFIAHSGITPDAESIAGQAARWLGLPSQWAVKYVQSASETGALQQMPEPKIPYRETRTRDQIERDEREMAGWREREANRAKQEARNRLKSTT